MTTAKEGIKLTKRTVDALPPRVKPYVAFDSEMKGFGCRVMPSGVKSYVLEYRPGAGGRAVAKKRLTLGKHGTITAEEARRAAADALARVRLGEDPQQEKAARRGAMTIAQLIAAFLEGHVRAKCKGGTAYGYKIALDRLRTAHGSLSAEALRRADVAVLHARLRSTPYAANRFLAARGPDAQSSGNDW
jgi:hypothetical protein